MTKEQLHRFILDQSSESEKTEIYNWVLSENFEADLESFITQDLEETLNSEEHLLVGDLSQIKEKIKERLSTEDPQEIQINQSQQEESYRDSSERRTSFPWVARIAASVALVALFVSIALYFTRPVQEDVSVAMITKENLRGRKSTIFLKDGSTVYLNSESKIIFPERFSDSARTVALDGEAFFDVAKDEAIPFFVNVGDLQVKVLGTSFNINAFQDSEVIKISLNSGSVQVSGPSGADGEDEAIALKPGESVSYIKKQNGFTHISAFDAELDLSWKDGKLVFKGAEMEEMFQQFERWYDVDFELKNAPYFAWNYDGTFEKQTLEDVLELLSFSQSFEYDIDQKKVTIVFKPN